MPRGVASTCAPLAPWSEQLYLWSLVSSRSHALLRHWLRHYRLQGIRLESNAELIIEGSGEELLYTQKALHQEGVSQYTVYSDLRNTSMIVNGVSIVGVNAWLRAGVNDFLSRSPPNAWLIWADVDEFFTWPCDIQLHLGTGHHVAVCGKMQDRVSANWELAKVALNQNITTQFPLCARIRRDITNGLAIKITLLRTRVDGVIPKFSTAHTAMANSSRGVRVIGGYHRQNCFLPSPMQFAHYSTTDKAKELAEVKKEDFLSRDGPAHAGSYVTFSKLFQNGYFTESARRRIQPVMEPCQSGCDECSAGVSSLQYQTGR